TPLSIAEALSRDVDDGVVDGVDASGNPPVRVVFQGTNVSLISTIPGRTFAQDLADGIAAATTSQTALPPITLMSTNPQGVQQVIDAIRVANLSTDSA